MAELDKEQQKAFVDEIMAANNLKGASKKRLIVFLCERYGWDKQKVQHRLKRATLAQRYAESH
ncbi:MAG: hypothetical protein ACC612_13210 [Methanomethylovorans sp.]|jgi:uncharacterized protein (DUF2132 family)|uniref:hypothetical protein n=1 Tax=Methanomethylovorans sp. TaxID=2758717 RepID=UPI0009CBF6F6|nr:MAG: hypothetical protein A4E23_00624 [Methanomethylovorans sp. PtaU1.Bin073]